MQKITVAATQYSVAESLEAKETTGIHLQMLPTTQKLMGKKSCRRPIRIHPTQRQTFARLTEQIRGTNYWLQLCKNNQRIQNSPAINRG
jgi:uncharacterized protein YcgL (UPF0745 family)